MLEPWPLEAWPNMPTKYLLCRDDRMFPAEWTRRLVRERLGITPTRWTAATIPSSAGRRNSPIGSSLPPRLGRSGDSAQATVIVDESELGADERVDCSASAQLIVRRKETLDRLPTLAEWHDLQERDGAFYELVYRFDPRIGQCNLVWSQSFGYTDTP